MKMKVNAELVALLAAASACVYLVQNLVFRKPGDTFFYLLQDLAFVPVQAIIASLILNKLLSVIEKRYNTKKINVIISAFFADTGISLLRALARNENHSEFHELLTGIDFKDTKKIAAVKRSVRDYPYSLSVTPEKLANLKGILSRNRGTLIGMLENAHLSEHDSFTDMLWAVFHVADELAGHDDFADLTAEDLAHLKGDILRAYPRIILEWIGCLEYLRSEYPYLFSKAIRQNPFKPEQKS